MFYFEGVDEGKGEDSVSTTNRHPTDVLIGGGEHFDKVSWLIKAANYVKTSSRCAPSLPLSPISDMMDKIVDDDMCHPRTHLFRSSINSSMLFPLFLFAQSVFHVTLCHKYANTNFSKFLSEVGEISSLTVKREAHVDIDERGRERQDEREG